MARTTSERLVRGYTAAVGLVAAGSVAFALNAGNAADDARAREREWQREALRWQETATAAVTHDEATAAENRRLVRRYNRLVRSTRKSERKLLAALKEARELAESSTPVRYVGGGTTYRYASSGGGSGGAGYAAPAGGGVTSNPAPPAPTSGTS